jgi:hypothetical protein
MTTVKTLFSITIDYFINNNISIEDIKNKTNISVETIIKNSNIIKTILNYLNKKEITLDQLIFNNISNLDFSIIEIIIFEYLKIKDENNKFKNITYSNIFLFCEKKFINYYSTKIDIIISHENKILLYKIFKKYKDEIYLTFIDFINEFNPTEEEAKLQIFQMKAFNIIFPLYINHFKFNLTDIIQFNNNLQIHNICCICDSLIFNLSNVKQKDNKEFYCLLCKSKYF